MYLNILKIILKSNTKVLELGIFGPKSVEKKYICRVHRGKPRRALLHLIRQKILRVAGSLKLVGLGLLGLLVCQQFLQSFRVAAF
ncbi:MAG: hypothetical protein LLF82_001048 [Dehalococcoides mccartyi]|nr:hypothetical protein [Dehalococcoides mccartyi]MEA2121765.1 hypothetical protein [Dehalococcoides mccartyi]